MPANSIILLSGGLDSATVLAMARAQGFACFALSMDYGQRHAVELEAARRVAASQSVAGHKILQLGLDQIGGSALTDETIDVPEAPTTGIPQTYVPARNTVFLALALGWAEVIQARDIFIGVNAVDYSGYPDCRPEFIRAFQTLANLATKAGVEGQGFSIHAPLIDLTKAQIIARGLNLNVDYAPTISCYDPDPHGAACGHCDSCLLRLRGFANNGIADPANYARAT